MKILADPATHKARLDELVAREAAAKASIVELNAMAAETKRLHNTAQATNIVADNRVKAIEVREAELDQKAEQLQRSEATKSDASLSRREAAADAKENALARREAAVAKREADADASFAKIKTIMDAAMRR